MIGSSLSLGITLTTPAFFEPTRVALPAVFVEHFSFGFWLVDVLRPRLAVSLGARTPNPHLCFLQMAARLELATRCVAVSGWDVAASGDPSPAFGAAFNRDDIRASEAVLAPAATAYKEFACGSIDLLCFDAVPPGALSGEVLDAWLERLSPGAVILVHGLDTPGGADLWRVLSARAAGFVFPHGEGLGVLAAGAQIAAPLRPLFDPPGGETMGQNIQRAFARLGGDLKLARMPRASHMADAGDAAGAAQMDAVREGARARLDVLGKEAARLRALLRAQTAQTTALELERLQGDRQLLRQIQRQRSFPWQLRQMARTLYAGQRQLLSRVAKLFGVRTATYVLAKNRKRLEQSNLFDPVYYLRRYPDVAAAGIDPLTHYLDHGAAAGRDPNPVFQTRWYVTQYPDVTKLGENPLLHYLLHGSKEGRRPSPDFDPRWYLTANPDVAALDMDPLAHFLSQGRPEGRVGTPLVDAEELTFLKAARRNTLDLARFASSPIRPIGLDLLALDEVAVVMPVHSGLEETRACIESVLASRTRNTSFGPLILVDDCGPDPELRAYLQQVAQTEPDVQLLVNAQNQGFVASANRGMVAAGRRDVILLNSDTEVCGDWVDRMAAQAAADPGIATVTPFSNNATICSYPDIGEGQDLPAGRTLAELDKACATANAGRCVDIPTGVGFCMFIRRACLDDVGLFDADAFGKGYGEESDFCCRASADAWRHVLAGDVFVYHAGSVSFGDSAQARKRDAAELLRARHPGYETAVACWVREDPAFAMRLATEASVIRASGVPVILHILHPWGGGTEKQVADLMAHTAERAISLTLVIAAPVEGRSDLGLALFIPDGEGGRRVDMRVGALGDVSPLLRAFGLRRIHVHHALTAMEQLAPFLALMNLPYDLSIHDYALICPRINLAQAGAYCGEPDVQGCRACLAEEPPPFSRDIVRWREHGIGLIENADRVICPSRDVADRIRRYAPRAHLRVVPHELDLYRRRQPVRMPPIAADIPLRVAVLGILAEHKGGAFLLDCIEYSRAVKAPLEWQVIGAFPAKLDARASSLGGHLTKTGRYKLEDLPGLIARCDPHLIFFPQHWPETYSFTLSEAFAARRAVLVPPLGAFPERIAGSAGAFEYPLSETPRQMVERLVALRQRLLDAADAAQAAPLAPHLAEGVADDEDFYRSAYI
ncbi:glycosyltransferase [Roseixanthobacter glucoisosaccharinicivorans]|uniref:glycosyltransferase n=1 Tax=Roseixanthobacter glucoisosaccharinicivorans TaxID=3119923 RepID=UPI00372CCFF3